MDTDDDVYVCLTDVLNIVCNKIVFLILLFATQSEKLGLMRLLRNFTCVRDQNFNCFPTLLSISFLSFYFCFVLKRRIGNKIQMEILNDEEKQKDALISNCDHCNSIFFYFNLVSLSNCYFSFSFL